MHEFIDAAGVKPAWDPMQRGQTSADLWGARSLPSL